MSKKKTKKIKIKILGNTLARISILCQKALDSKVPHEIVIQPVKSDRSLAQNRLCHMWYGEISGQMFESPLETKARCKLDYGIPMLMASNEDFAEKWHSVTHHLGREELLTAADLFDVTSIMGIRMMAKFLTMVQDVHEAQGIELTRPGDMYWTALGIKR